jgi:hypothetical protein
MPAMIKLLSTALALTCSAVAAGSTADLGLWKDGGEGALQQRRVDRVEAYSTDVWNLRLPAGELSFITVDGDGDTDLDAYLYDENGNLIDSDTDLTDYCIVQVTPKWSGSFRLEIKNLGRVWNEYVLTLE